MCVTCIIAFFIPFTCDTLWQFYSMLFTKNNKLWNERKYYFYVYMATLVYHIISKEVKIMSVATIAFLDTHVSINKQPIVEF